MGGTAALTFVSLVQAQQADIAGKRSAAAQRKALTAQEEAQDKADILADEQSEQTEQALNAARRKKPDTSTILEKRRALASRSRTLLSGGSGAPPRTTGSTLLAG